MAMWASLSDDELIRKSDLIVLGEWLGHSILNTGHSSDLTVGVIAISEVLKGPSTSTVALVSIPAATAPRSSSDLVYRQGDRGLWLLRLRPNSTGIYLADHPQRFVATLGGEARIKQLRQKI